MFPSAHRWSLLVFVVLGILTSPVAGAAPKVGRRGFLGFGAWTLFGGGATKVLPTPAPIATPAIMTEVSPALLEYRGVRLQELLQLQSPSFQMFGELSGYGLTDLERLIIEDWRADDPAARAYISQVIADFDRRLETFEGELRRGGEDFDAYSGRQALEVYRSSREMTEARAAVRARVTDWPWSTFDWSTVYLDRIKRTEASLAPQLGVDVAQIYRLTEHATNPIDNLLATLGSERYISPIYSDRTVEAVARAFEGVLEPLGRRLRLSNSEFDSIRLRSQAVAVAAGRNVVDYEPGTKWPVFFVFKDVFEDVPTAEKLAPRYLALRARLMFLRDRTTALEPSKFREVALESFATILNQLEVELKTLNERLDALRFANLRYRRHYSRALDELNWDSFTRPVDPARALHWGTFLRAVAQRLTTDTSIADELIAEAQTPCVDALDPAQNVARLEHQRSLEIDLEDTKVDVTVTDTDRER